MSMLHLSKAVAETIKISLPTVRDAARGELTEHTCDERLDRWSRRLLEQAEMTFEVRGLEHVPDKETFVVMSNHQSLYDIPIIFQALGRRVRMVAKAELFKVPLWSHAMKAAGFVSLDRSNHRRAIVSLREAEQALANGTSIWIAPEGTRSPSGQLGTFKRGGFFLALNTKTRILPVAIDGTRNALVAKGRKVKNGAHVSVTVCPPVDPLEYGQARRTELIKTVRDMIAQHLEAEQGSVAPSQTHSVATPSAAAAASRAAAP